VITDKRYFTLGVVLLLAFAVVLGIFFTPMFDGKTGMQAADDLFNMLSKGSSYYIPAVAETADSVRGQEVSFKAKPDEFVTADELARVFTAAGFEAETADGKAKVHGDLGALTAAAAADADALYKGDTAALASKYGMDGRKVIYAWALGFKSLEKAFLEEGKGLDASFAKKVQLKALEPAYNFAGIPAAKISERLGISVFLLVFYVFYTIWYGFAVMFVFEGLGISASKGH
jgi:hypothetical protein